MAKALVRPSETVDWTELEEKIKRANELQRVLREFTDWLQACPELPEIPDLTPRRESSGIRMALDRDLATMNKTEACVALLEALHKPLTAKEVCRELSARGYPKLTARAAGNALYRAALKEKVHKHSMREGERRWSTTRLAPEPEPEPPADPGPYHGLTQRAAVLTHLRNERGGKVQEITDALIAGGLVSTARDPATSIAGVLSTLLKEKQVFRTLDGIWHIPSL